MKYVSCMGELFQMKNSQYKNYMIEMAKTGDVNLEKYGKRLGCVRNITDLNQEEAKDIVQWEKLENKKKDN